MTTTINSINSINSLVLGLPAHSLFKILGIDNIRSYNLLGRVADKNFSPYKYVGDFFLHLRYVSLSDIEALPIGPREKLKFLDAFHTSRNTDLSAYKRVKRGLTGSNVFLHACDLDFVAKHIPDADSTYHTQRYGWVPRFRSFEPVSYMGMLWAVTAVDNNGDPEWVSITGGCKLRPISISEHVAQCLLELDLDIACFLRVAASSIEGFSNPSRAARILEALLAQRLISRDQYKAAHANIHKQGYVSIPTIVIELVEA